jgi:methionyl-tRNA formyltransferase
MNKTLIIADSYYWMNQALDVISQYSNCETDVGISHQFFEEKSVDRSWVDAAYRKRHPKHKLTNRGPVGYNLATDMMAGDYTAIISLHCKQLFCKELCAATRCYNIHPGFLPFGRGWAPVTFARLIGGPVGATLHKIDALVDHGQIIERQEIPYGPEDTCATLWPKVQKAEADMFRRNFYAMHTGEIEDDLLKESTIIDEPHGPVRSKAEYEALLELDLSERVTMAQAIHRLAACSLGLEDAKLFFRDKDDRRIYVNLEMARDNEYRKCPKPSEAK